MVREIHGEKAPVCAKEAKAMTSNDKQAEGRLDLKAPRKEIELWRRAAAYERITMSEFIRNCATLAAVRSLPDVSGDSDG